MERVTKCDAELASQGGGQKAVVRCNISVSRRFLRTEPVTVYYPHQSVMKGTVLTTESVCGYPFLAVNRTKK